MEYRVDKESGALVFKPNKLDILEKKVKVLEDELLEIKKLLKSKGKVVK